MLTIIVVGVVLAVILAVVITIVQAKGVSDTDKQLRENGFTATRAAGALRVDDKNKKWCINDAQHRPTIYDFSEILDSKIEENSVLNKVNKLGVYIYTKNGGAIYISLINTETKRDSFIYTSSNATANQIYSITQSMVSHSGEKSLDLPEVTSSNSSPSVGDVEEQLRKLKSMADSGLITSEDYEAKKKQLLGL